MIVPFTTFGGSLLKVVFWGSSIMAGKAKGLAFALF